MDKEISEITNKALNKAWEAFEECLEKEDYDPANWDIRFTAWLKDANFEYRITKFEIEDEVKE